MLRSTIVTVLVLDTSPDWDRLVATVDRGVRVAPRFRQRLVGVPLGLAPPRWVPDRDFDLFWHVRRAVLSAPGDLSAALEFARTEVMSAFDPARPLWRFTVLDGLDGSRSALVLKVHHSMTDGIGGIQIADEIFDFARAGTVRGPVTDEPAPSGSGLRDIVGWNWSACSELVRDGIASAPTIARRVLTNPIGAFRDGGALAMSLFHLARPVAQTLSPVMTGRSLGRRLAVLDVPLPDLHRAAHRAGCTVNDAFLGAVLIGLRAYHGKYGAKSEFLRVGVPISLRTDADPIGGNRITIVRVVVPADIPGTGELMRALGAAVERWRDEPAVPWSNSVAAILNRLPTAILTAMFKHVDFIASDVPGSPAALFVAGAEIDRMYAFGPTTGTAFNITLVSHAGTCCVGVNADTAAVPDLPVLIDCLDTGFHTVITGGA